jgi:hypothetical protein
LAHLEQKRWSGSELNDFEVGMALEIDIFFHGIRRYGLDILCANL